jgi:hypothetical protein
MGGYNKANNAAASCSHFLFEGIIHFIHDPIYSELQIKAVIAAAINNP